MFFPGRLSLSSLLLLLDLTTGLDTLQYALTVLVELQLRNDHVRGVDTERDLRCRGELACLF